MNLLCVAQADLKAVVVATTRLAVNIYLKKVSRCHHHVPLSVVPRRRDRYSRNTRRSTWEKWRRTYKENMVIMT